MARGPRVKPKAERRTPPGASLPSPGVSPASPLASLVPARALAPALGGGTLTATAAVGLMATSAWLITRASERPPVLTLCVAIGAVQAFSLGKGLFRYLQRLSVHRLSLDVLGRLRLQLWDRLVPLVPAGLPGRASGRALSSFVSDTELAAEGFANATTGAIDVVASAVMGAVLAALVVPVLGAILLAEVLLVLPAIMVAARSGARLEDRVAAEREELASLVTEVVLSAPELVAYDRGDIVSHRLGEAARRGAAIERRRALAAGLTRSLAVLLAGGALAGTVATALSFHRTGRLTGVMVAVVVFTALAVLDQAVNLPVVLARAEAGRAARRRLSPLGQLRPPVEEPPDGSAPTVREGRQPGAGLRGSPRAAFASLPAPQPAAELEAASVRGAAGQLVLDEVSLSVGEGERVALVGPNGAGKTSCIYTLLHFLACASGRASLEGRDVSRLTRWEICSTAAWAQDDPHVFSASLRDNLRVGRASAGDDECWDALARSGLGRWAAELPDGLATRLGWGGRAVSAGERQRLGLARALLAGSPLLLLDEPTARLDQATAEALLPELLAAAGRRSVLVVSHDPLVTQCVDRAVRMDAGRVAAAAPPP